MCLQTIIDLYWSEDFLLNMSAELIGVTLEVALVTIIVRKYLDRRDRKKWGAVFSRKLEKILEVHHGMPKKIQEMEIMGDVNVAYRIVAWQDIIEDYLNEALAIIPPDYNEPMYKAVEKYQESLRRNSEAFINQSMNIDILKDINAAAKHLSKHLDESSQKDYSWDKEFLSYISKEFSHLEW